MSIFNIDDHAKRIRVSSRFTRLDQIPFDQVLKICRQQLSDYIPPEFITVETTNDNDYKYNYMPPDSTVTVDMFIITEKMFNNIRQYSAMMVDLERREEEVRKKEKEFKKLKKDLKHINELSKNVNQLFKGL